MMSSDLILNTLGYKIRTPDGFKDFVGIREMPARPVVEITFSNRKSLKVTPNHRLICPTGVHQVDELKVGDRVLRSDGRQTTIKSIIPTGDTETVYDIVGIDGSVYSASGVINHNCSFVTDDETLIDPMRLSVMESIEPVSYLGTCRLYSDILPNRTYLVALDPSMGTGGDYSAIEIFMMDGGKGMVQIGEWQHNRTDPRNQVRILLQLLMYIHEELVDNPDQEGEPAIFWTVENNSLGESILLTIENTGEERFPGTFVSERKKKGQARGRFRKGFNTDHRKKLAACARLKSLVESGRMVVNSKNLVRELKNFVQKERGYAAKPGENDDLVSSCLLVMRLLDVVIFWSGETQAELSEFIPDDEIYDGAMPVVV